MQFFYAYIADGTIAFDPDVHNTKDERVYGFSFAHNEGEFATMGLLVRNPRIGLLNPIRKQWLWASYQMDGSDVLVPFFKGRLVGLPGDMQRETLSLVYRGEPTNYDAVKAALAETLKSDPYWDEVWIDPAHRNDPDAVLLANPRRYHIDPVTHDVTVSHIIEGEDGTVEIDTGAQYVETLSIGLGEPPLRKINIDATVSWDQTGQGSIYLKNQLLRSFKDAGSVGDMVSSYTGEGLQSGWPQSGTNIGGGWAFGLSQLGNPSIPGLKAKRDFTLGMAYVIDGSTDTIPGESATGAFIQMPLSPIVNKDDNAITVRVVQGFGVTEYTFFLWKFTLPSFDVCYNATRKRSEHLAFSLEADVQDIITDVQAELTLTVRSQQLSEVLDDGSSDGGSAPIGDGRRKSYLNTTRGKRSLRYLIALASARLLLRARTLNMTLRIPFSMVSDVTCRKSARVIDPRLPGGEASGKIVGYAFQLDSSGRISATIKIAGTIGTGDPLAAPGDGDPTCVVADALGPDAQLYDGRDLIAVPDQVSYKDFVGAIDDDGVNFFDMRVHTVVAGARADNYLTINSVPNDGAEITIGGQTYVWRDAVDVTANEIRIADTIDGCMFNFASALIVTASLKGLYFGSATIPNGDIFPVTTNNPTVLRVVAQIAGPDGDDIVTTTSGGFASWQYATLRGGRLTPHGLSVLNGENVQRQVLLANQGGAITYLFGTYPLIVPSYAEFSTIEEVRAALNDYATKVKLDLIPVTGGPFLSEYSIDVSKLVVPKTIDLEAPSNA